MIEPNHDSNKMPKLVEQKNAILYIIIQGGDYKNLMTWEHDPIKEGMGYSIRPLN
jgi:hypothetical protein